MKRQLIGTLAALSRSVLCLNVLFVNVTVLDAQAPPAGDPTPAASPEQTSRSAPAAVPTPRIELQTVSGTVSGPIRSLSFAPDTGMIGLGGESTKLEDAVLIRLPKRVARRGDVELLLRGGEQVFVSLLAGDDESIRCTSNVVVNAEDLESPLAPSIDDLRALVLPAQFPTAASYLQFKQSLPGVTRPPIAVTKTAPKKRAERDGGAGDEDADFVTTLEGSRIAGVVNSVGARELEFEAEKLGKIKLALQKIRALTIADFGDDEPDDKKPEIVVAATLQDDSYVIGPLLELEPAGLRMLSLALGEIRVRLDDLRFLEIRGGRSVFLSDLDPSNVRHKEDLLEPRAVRRDANVLGGPIRIRDQIFRKGLGCLSHVRLDYELDGKFTRFRAVLGMDDAARPTTLAASATGGRAIFRIWVDDRAVFEKELSHRDAAYPLDIPLETMKEGVTRNAMRLGLEVDYGPGFLVLDYADWADARLIRE